MSSVEVRGFGDLKKMFDEKNWSFPLIVDLAEQTTAQELAKELDIPFNKIEIVFVNGIAHGLNCPVSPGDRVAFVPPGTPGPYRVILGFMQNKNAE